MKIKKTILAISGRSERYSAKTEGASYQGDQEEHQRVVKHGDSLHCRG